MSAIYFLKCGHLVERRIKTTVFERKTLNTKICFIKWRDPEITSNASYPKIIGLQLNDFFLQDKLSVLGPAFTVLILIKIKQIIIIEMSVEIIIKFFN